MVMVADPSLTLERKVRDRLRDDESHRRIAAVLTAVAVDAIHPARHLGLGRSASGVVLDETIESATRAAMETLVARLDDLVESLPRPTLEQLANEQLAAEFGLE